LVPPIQQLEWVRPPQQARSQHTLERILDAAEALISERGADGTTVAEVARIAESSVGSFYARFPDKDALLRCIAERFYQQAVDTVESVLAPERWDGYTPREIVESAVAFLIQIFHQKRRLIRAVAIRAVDDEALGQLGQRLGDVVTSHMVALLERRGELGTHEDPEAAVRLSVWMVLSAFHARCMYADDAPLPVREDRLAGEVSDMCLSYLGLSKGANSDVES
jgi:AcrR family transcriptional regulator